MKKCIELVIRKNPLLILISYNTFGDLDNTASTDWIICSIIQKDVEGSLIGHIMPIYFWRE